MSENQEFRVSPTSRRTANVEDLTLRTGERTRLIFRPMLVVNSNDTDACVRGEFRYQKKSAAQSWEDCETQSLSALTVDDGGFKLELHAGEVKQLVDGITRLCAVYQHGGIPETAETFTVAAGEMGALVRSLLERRNELEALGDDGVELLQVMIDVLTRTEQPREVARALAGSGATALSRLSAASQLAQLEGLLDRWRDSLDNADEGWWQKEFEENAWVLPQVFGQPFVMLQDQAYMGGKRIENSGGHVLDLLFKNALTENVALVEIKTPKTPLLGSQLRNNIWAFSTELSGSVTQLLSYKDDLQKEYYNRVGLTERAGGPHFEVFNPKCVLLVGNIGAEMSGDGEKCRSLELARNDFRSVEIVTYDEVLLRLELLLRVLTETGAAQPASAPADVDDMPF